jgi:light-regulated signal transduction histidine kinase (bacteriophytochrome)
MGELIGEMMNMSRVLAISGAERTELRRETVDLSDLANTVAYELREREPERQVEVVIPEGLVADADPRRLQVVLENLLGNSWKFTGKHPTAKIEFGLLEHEGGIAYFVRDDGAGFDAADADKLFVAFNRLHSATEFEGVGIGLATVQRIIQAHGGRVWAEGAVEQGATVYFTLP